MFYIHDFKWTYFRSSISFVNFSLDSCRREKTVDQITKEINQPEKHIDLGFKEGQTIKINFGVSFLSFICF